MLSGVKNLFALKSSRVDLEVDGEVLGRTPLDAEVKPGAATIIVPLTYAVANGLATAVETPVVPS